MDRPIDVVLEEIASEMERPDFLDLRGIAARRKRDREDADLRMRVRQEQRRELACWIRAFKTDGGRCLTRFLEEIRDGNRTDFAWGPEVAAAVVSGLVTLTISVSLTSHLRNCRPTHHIELTDAGRAMLQAAALSNRPVCESIDEGEKR